MFSFYFHGCFDEIENQQGISYQGRKLRQSVVQPRVIYQIDASEAHCRTDYTHQGTSGDESGCQ